MNEALERRLCEQRIRNIVKKLDGLEVLQIYAQGDNAALDFVLENTAELLWRKDRWDASVPYSLPEEELLNWVIDVMQLAEGHEYYFYETAYPMHFWIKMRLRDVHAAAMSLWRHDSILKSHDEGYSLGFMLLDSRMTVLREVGLDSRSEDRFTYDELPVDLPRCF